MKIETDVSPNDLKSFVIFVQRANLSPKSFADFAKVVLIGVAGGAAVYLALRTSAFWLDAFSFVAGLVFIYVVAYISSFYSMKKYLKGKDGFTIGKSSITLNNEGLSLIKDHYESLTKWPAMKSLEETDKSFYIMLDNMTGHIIPKKSFSDDAQMAEFKGLLVNNSVATNVYYDEANWRMALGFSRLMRVILFACFIFLFYTRFNYIETPTYLPMDVERVDSKSSNETNQTVKFMCSSNPDIGFIGHTTDDISEMLNSANDNEESLMVQLDGKQAHVSLAIFKDYNISFTKLESLDPSGEQFVECPEFR